MNWLEIYFRKDIKPGKSLGLIPHSWYVQGLEIWFGKEMNSGQSLGPVPLSWYVPDGFRS